MKVANTPEFMDDLETSVDVQAGIEKALKLPGLVELYLSDGSIDR